MALKFYTSVSVKRVKTKSHKFWGVIPAFVEATGEKLVRGILLLPTNLNTVNGERFSDSKNCFIFSKP